jgi:hypothetical protein
MTQLPQSAETGDVIDPQTRSRLNSVYPLIAALPSVVVPLFHFL